jgi:dihydroorotate dehydrogenase
MPYSSLIRPLLFNLPAETAHDVSLKALNLGQSFGLNKLLFKAPISDPCTVMGLNFPNRVGLAAGLDKNGAYVDALANFGFGFIEVGTTTPRPQPGNPKPRMFRLPEASAVINRLGFNNEGVDKLLSNIRKRQFKGILGINIGKNFDTPVENALSDYAFNLHKVYPYADYIAVNISSPNTPNLRQLQQGDALDHLLFGLKELQGNLQKVHNKYVPLAVKIAPDLSELEIENIAQQLLKHGLDGVIATNTTISRDAVANLAQANEMGGLSGAPVFARSTEVVRQLKQHLQDKIPIIAVGGILSGADALAKLDAGASLVQVYTGLVYRGGALVNEAAQAIADRKSA